MDFFNLLNIRYTISNPVSKFSFFSILKNTKLINSGFYIKISCGKLFIIGNN